MPFLPHHSFCSIRQHTSVSVHACRISFKIPIILRFASGAASFFSGINYRQKMNDGAITGATAIFLVASTHAY